MCYAFIYTGEINVYHEVIMTQVILKSCSRFLSSHQLQCNLPAGICVPAGIPLHSISIGRYLLRAEHPAIWAIAHQLHHVAYRDSFSFISLGWYDVKLWAAAGIVQRTVKSASSPQTLICFHLGVVFFFIFENFFWFMNALNVYVFWLLTCADR